MATGTVKRFSDAKGHGFIAPDERGPNRLVHFIGIADGGFRTLPDGSRVEFEVRAGKQGMEAFNVRPVARPAHQGAARTRSFLSVGPRARSGQADVKRDA